MSKEVRSISAHESILKYSKLLTQRKYLQHLNSQNYVKPFWPQNDFFDKESLYILNKSLKEEINQIKQENIKLKTKLQQYEKEFVGYERYLEEISKQQQTHIHKNQELLLTQLKKQKKDLSQLLEEKVHTIEQMKKSIKVTRVQEIEVENIVLKEEIQSLKKLLVNYEKSTKDQLMQTVVVQENFQKTQQGFIKQQKEINEMKLKQQQDLKQIQQLQVSVSKYQSEVQKITSEKNKLEEKLRKTVIENKQRSSTNSFRSNKFQATTEVSCTQLKTKYQDELQYKLIIRGITYDQFSQMISELKQQAEDMKKQITKEDIEYILTQEPFLLSQERVQDVVKSLSGTGQKLADSLLNQIGKYKTFFDYPQFNIQEAENQITKTLKQNDLTTYVSSISLKKWTKEDVFSFITKMKFDWSESTKLFYLLNLFEKSGQVLEFDENTILDPFPQLESSRIVEESDEDLFDQKSDKDSQRVIIEDHDEYIT